MDFVSESIFLSNQGCRLADQGKVEAAFASWRRAIDLCPSDPIIIGNVITSLVKEYRFSEALDYAALLKKMGVNSWISSYVYGQKSWFDHDYDLATCFFKEAISHKEIPLDHRIAYPISLLLSGKWKEGFREYSPHFTKSSNKAPKYTGGREKSVLVFHEQGLGDILNFSRLAISVQSLGVDKVFLSLPGQLQNVLGGFTKHKVTVIRENDVPNLPVDAQIGMMELLGMLKLEPDRIPPIKDVILYEPTKIEKCKGRLRVGICWSGNPAHPNDRQRSMSLIDLAPLFELSNCEFFSLQSGISSQDIKKYGFDALIRDMSFEMSKDLVFTAGIVKEMDVIVTVDTMVAHLAGCMNKRTFLLIPTLPDWRWLARGDRTYWYEAIKIIRQSRIGDWKTVVGKVARELRYE